MLKACRYNIPHLVIFMVLITFISFGCSELDDITNCDCDDEIAKLIKKRGQPEEIERFDSGNYHSHTYWYWCSGYSKTFTWGGAAGCCETSTYTFSPICP